jgi:hypothetical protein
MTSAGKRAEAPKGRGRICSKKELSGRAGKLGISVHSGMTKEALARAIRKKK